MDETSTSISEQKDFLVNSASLKDVRSFSREVFEKANIDQDLKDELVLAIAVSYTHLTLPTNREV